MSAGLQAWKKISPVQRPIVKVNLIYETKPFFFYSPPKASLHRQGACGWWGVVALCVSVSEPKEKRQRWKKPKEIPYDGTAENRASKHWSPTKYRNRFGCFSDQAFLAQYFSGVL